MTNKSKILRKALELLASELVDIADANEYLISGESLSDEEKVRMQKRIISKSIERALA